VESLEALAPLFAERGRPERAVQLISAAARLREAAAEPPRPSLQPILGGAIEALRAALSAEAFVAAWTVGQTTSLEQIIGAMESDSPERYTSQR
jgi:hypothetical protein